MHTQRQAELIEAAIKLTAADGIQKLTIRNVAAAIGVSEAAVYRHFASKHDLLKAIIAHLDSLLAPQFSALLTSESSYADSLTQFLSNLFSLLEHNDAFSLMLFAEETFNVDIELKPELGALLSKNLQQITRFYERAMEEGRCRTDLGSAQLALITFGTIRLSVSRWHLATERQSLYSQAQEIGKNLGLLFSLN